MLIIWGWRTYTLVLRVFTMMCAQCAMPAEHVLRRVTRKFTLFFIPLFPVGRKHILTCTACQAQRRVPGQEVEQLMAAGAPMPQQPQPMPQPAYGPPPPAQQVPPQFRPGPPPPMPRPPAPYGSPQNYGPPRNFGPQQGFGPQQPAGYPPRPPSR